MLSYPALPYCPTPRGYVTLGTHLPLSVALSPWGQLQASFSKPAKQAGPLPSPANYQDWVIVTSAVG